MPTENIIITIMEARFRNACIGSIVVAVGIDQDGNVVFNLIGCLFVVILSCTIAVIGTH